MSTREVQLLVLGAGLAGLGAGVAAQRRGLDSLVLDAAAEPGGLCRSTTVAGCRFDYGPKILLLDGSPAREELLGFLNGNVARYPMAQQTYLRGVGLAGFPIQRHLADLPPAQRARALADLTEAWASSPEPDNYRDWLIANFGRYLCERVLFPYEEKKWLTDLSVMTHEWALGRPTAVDRSAILAGAARRPPPTGTYYYLARGSMSTLANAIAAQAGPLRGNSTVVEVHPQRRYVVVADGTRYRYRGLISTLPLDELVRMTRGVDLGVDPATASRRLRWLAIQVVNLVFARRGGLTATAIHFPDPEIPFRRVCVLENLCPALGREAVTPISIELSTMTEHQGVDVDAVVDALRQLPEFHGLGHELGRAVLPLRHAYPIQLRGSDGIVDRLRERYAALGVDVCGRGGTFRYINCDIAYQQGKDAVQRVFASAGRLA